jgi:hypothetical protein
MHRLEHLPCALGWPLTHLRCRLPRLFIAGWRGAGGGEQVHQGLFGDADTAADADRAQLAPCDRLVELVAPDSQDGRGLAGGEHLGQGGQRARGGAGHVEGRRGGGGSARRRAVARIGDAWPSVLLRGWCCGRWRPVCPAVGDGGGGTIPRFHIRVWGVLPGGWAHRAAGGLAGEGGRSEWQGFSRRDRGRL